MGSYCRNEVSSHYIPNVQNSCGQLHRIVPLTPVRADQSWDSELADIHFCLFSLLLVCFYKQLKGLTQADA